MEIQSVNVAEMSVIDLLAKRDQFKQRVANGLGQPTEWGYHRQGSCQAGFSATFSKDGRKLFVGAVGSWYWQGQVFIQDLLVRADNRSTNEQPPHYDDSYMGYSMAAGEFSNDDQVDVAVGVPRGNNLTGKVIVYNSSLVALYEIFGQQIASYFGYAIVVGDIDGDNNDDVIVSAPMYSNFQTKDGHYETGRVYVVYQGNMLQKKFKEWDMLDGQNTRARFGLSLASLGDLNRDSYGDFAVGAPYDGPNGGGAVYIYHGSRNKVNKKPSQIIYASDIQKNLKTFGYSLSGGLDLDNNEYTDVIVGAYSSDRVIFLRSRPIVSVSASVNITPEKINLDDKKCQLLDGSLVACMSVLTCLQYVGDAVPIELDFEVEVVLDSTMDSAARLFFLIDEHSYKLPVTMNCSKGISKCDIVNVYIKSDIRDKLTPITIEMKYKLSERKLKYMKVKPILNQYILSTKKKQVNILKNCGKDNICIPQLSVTAESIEETYVQGSKENLELQISISNVGEDAFETMFYLEIPSGINYVKIDRREMPQDVHITCSGPSFNNSVLKCDVGNPLKANKSIQFKVLLEPFYLNSSDINYYNFTMLVNSTNPENSSSLKDNEFQFAVPIVVETELIVSGISDIDPVFYNKSVKMPKNKVHEADIGPEIIHIYDVKNRGPSSILEAVVIILWPTYTLFNKHLLYLIEKPEVIGNGRCEDLPNINPLNLTVEHKPYLLNSGNVVTMDINGPMNDDGDNSQGQVNSTTHEYIPLTKERKRRQSENGFQNELSCGPTLCTQIHCQVYNIAQGQHVLFRIRSRLATETLDQYDFDNVTISSKLVTKATKLPYSVKPDELDYKVYVVSTMVNPTDVDVIRKTIPWWIIASAVCTGVLVLGLLIIVLWRLGFFKRKRPLDEFDREPLNKTEKNGILELSDEAL
ncbi:hypothetical protein CHUAL_013467 [Chamberlinius hualienensis]